MQLQQTFLTIILKLSMGCYGGVWEHSRFTLMRQKKTSTGLCQLETEPLVPLVWVSTAQALTHPVHTLLQLPPSVSWTLAVKTKLLPLPGKFQHITGPYFQALHTPYTSALCSHILLWRKHTFSLKPKFSERGLTPMKTLQIQCHTNCMCIYIYLITTNGWSCYRTDKTGS